MKTLSQFQNKFETALENSINKKFTLENEVKEVLNYINTIPTITKLFTKPIKPSFENRSNRIFEINIPNSLRSLFSEAFTKYITVGDYELKRSYQDTNETYQIKEDTVKQAYTFSEYYKWLSSYNINQQKDEDFSVGLRLLSLEYLGVDLLSNDKTKIARTLAPIFGMHPQTIRTSLTYLHIERNEIRTIENLLKLKEFFKKQGHKSIVTKIEKDIEALK